MAQTAVQRSTGPHITRMSDRGVAWLSDLEGGCRLEAYLDTRGIPTIGVGMTEWPLSNRRVELGDTIPSEQVGMTLFRTELRSYEAKVDSCTYDAISQETFDSMTSFCYNIGRAGFAGSTAVRLLNEGRPLMQVAEAMMLWDKPPEIVPRRQCEADLLVRGIYHLQGAKVA